MTTANSVFALLKLLARSIRLQIILRLIAQNNIHLDCTLIIYSTKSSNHRRQQCFLNYILLLLTGFTCLSIFSGVSNGGGGLGDPGSPLFLDQTEARRAKKIFFETAPPPPPRLILSSGSGSNLDPACPF